MLSIWWLPILLLAIAAGVGIGYNRRRRANPWGWIGTVAAGIAAAAAVLLVGAWLMTQPWAPKPVRFTAAGQPVFHRVVAPEVVGTMEIVCPDGQPLSKGVCSEGQLWMGSDGLLYDSPQTLEQFQAEAAKATKGTPTNMPTSTPATTRVPTGTVVAATQTPNVIVVTATPVATGTPVPTATATSALTRTPAPTPNVVPSATATAVLGAQPPVYPVCGDKNPATGKPPVVPCWLLDP